jgi:mannosyltransferase OCH1-like enzyme
MFMFMSLLVHAQKPQIDFDTAMRFNEFRSVLQHDFAYALYTRAKQLYERYAPDVITRRSEGTIPYVIHHIWFGIPLRQEDKDVRATWEKHHPEPWQFVLWTDRVENDPRGVVARTWQEVDDSIAAGHRYITVDVEALSFDNRIFFDETVYYGERSDILKWEIIHRMGGMYCDFDFTCLASFDAMHDQYDFYTGMQPLDTSLVQLGAALFAARRGHPILQHAVATIAADRVFMPIVIKTGPIHFSKSFLAVAGRNGSRDIAFPASFFYPCGYCEQDLDETCWRRPESLAVHRWAGSWLKPEAIAAKKS